MIPGWGHRTHPSPVGGEPRESLQTWLCLTDVPRSEAQPVFSKAPWVGVLYVPGQPVGPAGWGEENREEKQTRRVVFLLGLWKRLKNQLCCGLGGDLPQTEDLNKLPIPSKLSFFVCKMEIMVVRTHQGC